jgi:hypothetical protein
MIRGELEDIPLPSGAHQLISREFQEVPVDELRAVMARTRELLEG